jgi:diadenosine tetraphosphate (Ap4A) HIT family hydrolase
MHGNATPQQDRGVGATAPKRACFLCDPAADLIFFENDGFFALAGLGPVVEGYALFGTRAHIKSMADLPSTLWRDRDRLIGSLRDQLSRKFGRCLVTEHGRMAVCADDPGDYEAHCFHAHFLLFPGARDVSEAARSYFSRVDTFTTLQPAMGHAALCDEYALISPTPETFNVFSGPLNIPRQLARFLVANDVGELQLADWRDHPNREQAEQIARDLKLLIATNTSVR